MLIREMHSFDLNRVVAIHQKAFRGFFLTRMGPCFLRAYYQAVLDFEASNALVACDAETGDVLGFVTGFGDPEGFYSLFRQRRKRMLPLILRAILRDPALLPQILRNMRRVSEKAYQSLSSVELSSIAVDAAGCGIGGFLLDAFVDEVRSNGAQVMVLTTDADQNEVVRRFYEGRGFALDRIETRGRRRLCHYVRKLG